MNIVAESLEVASTTMSKRLTSNSSTTSTSSTTSSRMSTSSSTGENNINPCNYNISVEQSLEPSSCSSSPPMNNNESTSTLISSSQTQANFIPDGQGQTTKMTPESQQQPSNQPSLASSSKLKRANSSSSSFEDREKVRSRLGNLENIFNKDSIPLGNGNGNGDTNGSNNSNSNNSTAPSSGSTFNGTSNNNGCCNSQVRSLRSSGSAPVSGSGQGVQFGSGKLSNHVNNHNSNNELLSPFDQSSLYFRFHKSIQGEINCKMISTDEACHFLISHYTNELPEVETMFPWLHGVHKNNLAQITFLSHLTFGMPQNGSDSEDEGLSHIPTPSNVRGLMVVRSSNTNGDVSSAYENIITETVGLVKGTVSSDDILVSANGIRNMSLYLTNSLDERILDSFSMDSILRDVFITKVIPIFKDLDPQSGISLRNFHIQVEKMSNISDILVYCFNHDHRDCMSLGTSSDNADLIDKQCKCIPLARLIHIAQLQYMLQHPELNPDAANEQFTVHSNIGSKLI
ncbi:unnamed protein product [Ambrosiozyma monospora]|uniref:Unnamed protein product n=1 Tax=Ambrosiozyma monospora TaxID=43982 RepID=A0A9W6WE76_AMBMO|nr:unnamed protein product [Ambrosiozyma monospora]